MYVASFFREGQHHSESKSNRIIYKCNAEYDKRRYGELLLEGIAYEIRNNLDIVEGQIGKAEQIHIGGGLSNSHEFNQIQADVYGKKTDPLSA